VTEFSDIVLESVRPNPANVKPMDLEVDEKLWHVQTNHQPPRMITPLKQAETQTQVQKYLTLGVIEPSTATYYSQTLFDY
jgi:hypothetical protein